MKNIVELALSKVGQKVTVPTNPYGGQCVALVDWLLQQVTNGKYNLSYTNAIDVLKKAQQQGIPVEYDKAGAKPKASAIIVYDTGDKFGHVEIVVADSDGSSLVTVGQNVDGYTDHNRNGINDQLEIGGGGVSRRRHYAWYANGDAYNGNNRIGKVVGWFYPPTTKQEEKTNNMSNTIKKGQDIYSSLTTHFDLNPMFADSNRTKIDRIVIHHNFTTNDDVARRTWYISTGKGTSAHYQITPDKIWGCVGENFVAYHAGNYAINQRSIGLEHLNDKILGRNGELSTIAEPTYANSAKLIADICKRYNIPCDRKHIIKHSEASATSCPAGINIDKLISMAKAIIDGKETKPSASVTVKNIDQKALTYDVVVSNIKSDYSVLAVYVPTWSEEKGQDDLVWHLAVKQPNGEYTYKVKASEHKNGQGEYHSHVYILTNTGKKYLVGTYDVFLSTKAPSAKVSIVSDNKEGQFTVTVTDAENLNGVKEVVIPVWSEKDGQDDIKWYTMEKVNETTYTKTIKITDHKGTKGKYNVHLYFKQKNDQLIGVSSHVVEIHELTHDGKREDEVIVVTKGNKSIKHIILTEEEFNKLKKE